MEEYRSSLRGVRSIELGGALLVILLILASNSSFCCSSSPSDACTKWSTGILLFRVPVAA